MKWQQGDWWTVTIRDVQDAFQYKYVVIDQHSKKAVRWEEGLNRICDPAFLDDDSEPSSASTFEDENDSKRLEDEWEHFTVTFSIFYPVINLNETMRINGDSNKLGGWNKGTGPVQMVRGKPRRWLTGETVTPWELANVRFTHKTMPSRMVYKYSIVNSRTGDVVWEREPSRFLKIVDPSQY